MSPDAAINPDLLDRIKAKRARNNKKAMSLYTAKLDAAEAANDASTIYISVEWKKSRVWGANPTATVTGSGSYSTGYASGCGYDKESAAIAEALNDNPVIMRILYEHADKGGAFPYGVTTWAGVPSFDGGCGVSVFYNIFISCGIIYKKIITFYTLVVYLETISSISPHVKIINQCIKHCFCPPFISVISSRQATTGAYTRSRSPQVIVLLRPPPTAEAPGPLHPCKIRIVF